MGCKRTDGTTKTVLLPIKSKKALLKRYKGRVVNLVEKIHCILIYYCIRDILKDVDRIIVCEDISFRKITTILPPLFSQYKDFSKIKICRLDYDKRKSNGHWPAVKAFRKKAKVDKILNKYMVESKLFKI